MGVASPSAVVPYSPVAAGPGHGPGSGVVLGPGSGVVLRANPSRSSTRANNNHPHNNNNPPPSNLPSHLLVARRSSPAPGSQRMHMPPSTPAASAQGQGLGPAQGQGLADDLRRPSTVPPASVRQGPAGGYGLALPFPLSYAGSVRSRGSQDSYGMTDDFFGMLFSLSCPSSCSCLGDCPNAVCPLATRFFKGHFNLNKKFKLLRTSLFFLVFYLILWMTLLGYKGANKQTSSFHSLHYHSFTQCLTLAHYLSHTSPISSVSHIHITYNILSS